jgi:cyanophycinase
VRPFFYSGLIHRGVAVWLLALCLLAAPAHAGLFDYFKKPPRGSLMIVGGGDTPEDVQRRFVALAGGAGKARIAVLPMANLADDEEAKEVRDDFQKLGAQVQIVSLNRSQAQLAQNADSMAGFSGFWYTGGDQSKLLAILEDTAVLHAIDRRFQAGAVVGGTSAGAAIMSAVMLTGRWKPALTPEETEYLNIAKGMLDVSRGFGIFKGAIVDQHFDSRARYNRLISAVLDHPQLVGVGIDEETALLVRPDGLWEVLGKHYVKLIDARKANIVQDDDVLAKARDIRLHVLPAGSTFEPKNSRIRFATP